VPFSRFLKAIKRIKRELGFKIIVHTGIIDAEMAEDLKKAGIQPSNYQGPTTITYLIAQNSPDLGIETATFIVSLPQYVNVEEDYLGKVRLLEILNVLYDIPIDKKDFDKAARQRSLISQKVEASAELKQVLPHLEAIYGGCES
jgi:hypothetical protein